MITYDPISNSFSGGSECIGSIPNLMWHITDRCPLSCPYCFAPKSANETPQKSISTRIASAKQLGVLKIDISGGEPLVYPHLEEVCEETRKCGIFQTITTSGFGRPENVDYIVNNCTQFTRVIVSLDSPEREGHDKLRGSGAYADAMELIKRVSNISPKSLRINTVVTQNFLQENWLSRMQALVARFQAEWCIIQPHPANRKEMYELHDVDDNQFKKVLSEARTHNYPRTISRSRNQYSTYWSLQPNGTIRQHSSGEVDRIGYSLDDTPISEILEGISRSPVSLPSSEGIN